MKRNKITLVEKTRFLYQPTSIQNFWIFCEMPLYECFGNVRGLFLLRYLKFTLVMSSKTIMSMYDQVCIIDNAIGKIL